MLLALTHKLVLLLSVMKTFTRTKAFLSKTANNKCDALKSQCFRNVHRITCLEKPDTFKKSTIIIYKWKFDRKLTFSSFFSARYSEVKLNIFSAMKKKYTPPKATKPFIIAIRSPFSSLDVVSSAPWSWSWPLLIAWIRKNQ